MIQIPLNLTYPPALGGDDYLVAPCNAEAEAWLSRWPDWPTHGLALYGPEGCGKTHRLTAFAAGHGGVLRTAADLTFASVPGLVEDHAGVALDDLDGLADEAALLHLFNLGASAKRFLLLAGRQPPARLPIRLPDLASRLNTLPAIGITAPGDEVLAAVIAKQFADRGLKVGDGVISLLLKRGPRSFADARRMVEDLDRAALASARAVTPALVRQLLSHPHEESP